MGALRFLCFLAIVGVLSNTAQYLMTGPSFSGLSGSVVGMAAFIWMRQRKAAWETYFMHWGVSLFLLYFVVGMFILGLTTFFMQIASSTSLSPHIGNTAHITGGAVGFILGKLDFFAERRHA
jgi:GlpG protein